MDGAKLNNLNKSGKQLTQEKRVYVSLYRKPKTRLQVSRSEDIPIQNICRYVGSFRRAQCVHVLRIARDPLSGVKAEYLTTNPSLIPGHLQLLLW